MKGGKKDKKKKRRRRQHNSYNKFQHIQKSDNSCEWRYGWRKCYALGSRQELIVLVGLERHTAAVRGEVRGGLRGEGDEGRVTTEEEELGGVERGEGTWREHVGEAERGEAKREREGSGGDVCGEGKGEERLIGVGERRGKKGSRGLDGAMKNGFLT